MIKLKDLTKGRHVLEYGSALAKKFNILKTIHCNPRVFTSFLEDVESSYLTNPYHNSIHGADVANSAAYFANQECFGKHFSELEISCLLVSALVHDLGHPGNTLGI